MSLLAKAQELFHVEHLSSQLGEYERILLEYNAKVNLISRTSTDEFRERHLLPCMAAAAHPDVWPQGTHIYDVGTGGGLPGIPLAIIRPDLMIHLVESKVKKVAFLLKAKNHLDLKNVIIEHQRVELLEAAIPASVITARFFGNISKLVSLSTGLRDKNSQLLVFKGDNEDLPQVADVFHLHQRIPLSADKILAHYVQP